VKKNTEKGRGTLILDEVSRAKQVSLAGTAQFRGILSAVIHKWGKEENNEFSLKYNGKTLNIILQMFPLTTVLLKILTYRRNHYDFHVLVVDKLLQPIRRIQRDRVKQGVVEEIINVRVAGQLKEALEGGLKLLEEFGVGRVEEEDPGPGLVLPACLPVGVEVSPAPLLTHRAKLHHFSREVHLSRTSGHTPKLEH
jgi:hypothetical protein